MSLVTIFSGPFCGAEAIAEQVAERMEYVLSGEDLLERAAAAHGTTAAKLARAMTGDRSLFDGLTHEREKSLTYIKAALAEALADDNHVLLGPAVQLVPRSIGHVLRVCIVADRDLRLRHADDEAGLTADEAAERIDKADQGLGEWTRQLHTVGPWDASLYDMKIPLPEKTDAEAVALICEGLTRDALRPTDRSVQATLDFLLASRLDMQLLERGYPYCQVKAADGNVTITVNKPPKRGALARAIYGLRLDKLERELREIALAEEGVRDVRIVPGAGLRPQTPRALLVDDEQEYVMTLSERLQMRDIETNVVLDGEQALSFVEADEPEVMVLDLRMPGIDGIEVLRRVKRTHPEIEVIVVTGHGNEKDEQAARELGAFDYLKKPVDINVLAERMRAASRKVRGEVDDPQPPTDKPGDDDA